MSDELEKKQELLKLVKEAERLDSEFRNKYQIENKFRFIRDRLQALVGRVEEAIASAKEVIEKSDRTVTENETLVYVYLFNAQGNVLQTWIKMLNPSVYYEYSVNRPIYQEKSYVDAIIRSKANKAQQGYITLCVNKSDILGVNEVRDPNGNPTIRVREGSLSPERFMSFTHNFMDYKLVDNQLVPK